MTTQVEGAEVKQESNSYDLACLNGFSRYRRHPGITEADCRALLAFQVAKMLEHRGRVCESDAGRISMLASISELPWESAHFSLPMAQLNLLNDGCRGTHAVADIVKAVLEGYSRWGDARHISAEVDVDDYVSLNALTKCGFEVLDFKRTYFTNRLAANAGFERLGRNIRAYSPDDLAAVSKLVDQVDFETRFTRDNLLDARRAKAVYRVWFDTLLQQAGQGSNALVYERYGEVVACGAIGEVDLHPQGVPVKLRGGSLYAATGAGVGAYGPILYRLTREAIATHGLVETTVSLNSSAATRVVEGVRPNKSVTRIALRLSF